MMATLTRIVGLYIHVHVCVFYECVRVCIENGKSTEWAFFVIGSRHDDAACVCVCGFVLMYVYYFWTARGDIHRVGLVTSSATPSLPYPIGVILVLGVFWVV